MSDLKWYDTGPGPELVTDLSDQLGPLGDAGMWFEEDGKQKLRYPNKSTKHPGEPYVWAIETTADGYTTWHWSDGAQSTTRHSVLWKLED